MFRPHPFISKGADASPAQSAISVEASECTSPRGRRPTTLLLVGHGLPPGHGMVRNLVWVVGFEYRYSLVSPFVLSGFLVSIF